MPQITKLSLAPIYDADNDTWGMSATDAQGVLQYSNDSFHSFPDALFEACHALQYCEVTITMPAGELLGMVYITR